MYMKEFLRMKKLLELGTEPRDLHFPPSNVKTSK